MTELLNKKIIKGFISSLKDIKEGDYIVVSNELDLKLLDDNQNKLKKEMKTIYDKIYDEIGFKEYVLMLHYTPNLNLKFDECVYCWVI